MASSIQTERLTVEDYRATPEGSRYQLVEGELHMAPAPNRAHQKIVLLLGRLLAEHVERRALGQVFVAPFDVFLDEHNVVQPDVMFVSATRESILQDDGCHGAPDLAIEVVSPSSAQLDKRVKRLLYARTGVAELWLVDPILEQVLRYEFARDTAKPVESLEEGETLRTPLLPDFGLDVGALFARAK